MNWNYCPNCGAKGTVAAESKTDYICKECNTRFWNNPRACVVFALICGNELVFSKRAIDPNKGKYDIPGGFLEYDEDPYQAAVREIKEETGFVADPAKLEYVTTYNEEYFPGVACIDLIFVYKVSEKPNLIAQDDSAALEWKPLSFIRDDKFVDHYTGLDKILEEYLKK